MAVDKTMSVEEVLEKYPDAAGAFIKHKIRYISCGEPSWGTIEEIAKEYGVPIDVLIADLNRIVEKSRQ